MFIIMTGTSLQDLPSSKVGNEMCDNDKNPKGEAIDETNEMKAYSRNRSPADRVDVVIPPLICFEFCLTSDVLGGNPTTARQVVPGLLLVSTRKSKAEQEEKADWTVLRNTTARNRSLSPGLSSAGYGVVETRIAWVNKAQLGNRDGLASSCKRLTPLLTLLGT
jgi:hypothetical protein